MPRRLLVPAAVLAVAASAFATQSTAHADPPSAHTRGPGYTFAVIGDVPYGTVDEADFPRYIAKVNADPDVQQVTHVGDIKSGSTLCDDERLERVRRQFDLFEDPLYYTPGDNEWTDCHRANNGRYHPLERLDKIRQLFFTPTGRTQGDSTSVRSQADQGSPENFRWTRANLSFATLHVVGSNNDLAPWTGNTGPTPAQVAEEQHRMDVTIANVRATFADAKAHHRRAVVLMQQADMFDETLTTAPAPADYSAFTPLVQTLVDESRAYGGQVYLFNGDSHVFRQDAPLAKNSPWLAFYGVHGSADNLRRVTVDGSNLGEKSYTKASVTPRGSSVLSISRVPTS